MAGIKPLEVRSWWHRHRGVLGIHAGRTADVVQLRPNEVRALERIGTPLGVVLGTVEVIEVCRYEDLPKRMRQWGEPGAWHWVVRNPRPFKVPVPAVGKLGFWDWDGEA
jgi:hypothetical protein